MIGSKSRIMFVALLSVSALACGPSNNPPAELSTQQAISPDKAAEVQRTIVAFMECEECNEGQVEAVKKLGPLAVESLATLLQEGPPAASRALQREHVVTTYRRLQEYTKSHPDSHPVAMSEEETVQLYSQNYITLYQTHAAQALGAIGGDEARKALTHALELPLSEEVRAVVRASLEQTSERR
jgi:hypothetical protein